MDHGDPKREQATKLTVKREDLGGIVAGTGVSGFGISLVFHNLWLSIGFVAIFAAGGIISFFEKKPQTEDNKQ